MGTPEAVFGRHTGAVEFTAATALSTGQVLQLPDGRAGVISGRGPAAGDTATAMTWGRFTVQKDTSVLLAGQQVWWDAGANKATHSSVTGDFPIGMCVEDATGTTAIVDLNRSTHYAIEQGVDEWEKTETLGLGVETLGGADKFAFDAVTEAATAALLSVESIEVGDKPIFEALINVVDNGDSSAVDINVGLANATHPTDADLITESVFFHMIGNLLLITAESDDGTNEVPATGTGIDFVEGTYFFVQIDVRKPEDIQMYINGVLILPATVFRLDAATGPLKALVHVTKSSDNTTADVRIRNLRAYEQQAA